MTVRRRIGCSLLLLCGVLSACGHSEDTVALHYPDRPPTADTMMPSDVSAAVAKLPEPDRGFVRETAGAHMAAIRFGQVAMQKGSTARVRAIGREMADAHTALQD